MPVEKDINLDKPLTEEELRGLEEDANRLEKLAEDAQDSAKKAKEFQKEEEKMLNDAVKKIEQLEKQAEKAEKAKNKIGKSIKEVNQLAQHRSALGGQGGADQFAEREEFGMGGMIPGAGQISGGRTAFGTGQEKAPMGGMATAQKKFEMAFKEAEKIGKEERKKNADAIRDNARKLGEQKKIVSEIRGGVGEALSYSRNPIGMGMGQLKGMVGKAGIYGFIAVAVISMAEQIYQEIKRWFGPGGPMDIRKEMMDRDREMIEMDNILARRAGRVFFTSDTELRQGAPEDSNTTRLGDRMRIYQGLHLGE